MTYIFSDKQDQAEFERLQLIEGLHDSRSKRIIKQCSVPAKGHCLEIGPGAGSILRWLGSDVVPQGSATAVDLNTRFATIDAPDNSHLIEGDVRASDLPTEHFDLIHGRFVFAFLPPYPNTLRHLLAALKPGGWIIFEEVDFSAARLPPEVDGSTREAFFAVNEAIRLLYAKDLLDFAMGQRLSTLFSEAGLRSLGQIVEDAIGAGGSPIAEIMRRSVQKLYQEYLETGVVTVEQLHVYEAMCARDTAEVLHHRTIAAWGQKP